MTERITLPTDLIERNLCRSQIKPEATICIIQVLATASSKNITNNLMTHIEAINIYTGMPLVDILNAFGV
jgi:hypothetical protein